jgi:4-hydroxy-tetrahydrodipicolinate synthase
MTQVYFGLSAALAMPFDEQGHIDTKKAIAHARWCLANGCGSVTLFGTTGEGASIGSAERGELLASFIRAGVKPSDIVVGVMANSIPDAALQAGQALEAGCRGVLLAPPSYFKGVGDDGLFDWFSGVFKAIGAGARGFYLYNIPSVTAVELSVALIGRLKSAFPGAIAGVKDSSGNWPFTQTLLAAHGELAILIGDERCLAAGVRLGGQGAISGMANICPERMASMVYEGRDDTGLTDFVNELVKYPVIPAVKAMVAHRSGDREWLATRAPLQNISEGDAKRLAGLFDRIQQTAAA